MIRTNVKPPFLFRLIASALAMVLIACWDSASGQESPADDTVQSTEIFREQVQPLLKEYCLRCHNATDMKSGVRLDRLTGLLEDRHLRLWEHIQRQITDGAMPPKDEAQPTPEQRTFLVHWIDKALKAARSRPVENNGSVRRLTVSQYQNTLRDLLKLDETLTEVLPPDGVTKEGFANTGQDTALTPLQVEAWFDIAEKALDLCIVDEASKPLIQNFRMNLGSSINPKPCPDKLILGANSHLLQNQDVVVTELNPAKPFAFEPFRMRTKYEFIEGYQGNATVRGWRKYDSIYHSVFACMRGNEGYPKGQAYETISNGLLLRPAIPSAELFGVESTYGPKANFKISLRELPDHGNFRVTVNAARYDDGLLLDADSQSQYPLAENAITVTELSNPQTIHIPAAGIYQADVDTQPREILTPPDASRLSEGLMAAWTFDGDATGQSDSKKLVGQLVGGAKFVDSPFGQAVSVDGRDGAIVVPRDDVMNVADGDFTVAAWIHPRELRQGGIVCLGKYNWTHGWYFDMPDNRGVLRIETVSPQNKSNGTVASPPGMIRVNTWQHVAAVVRRGSKQTRLYVNGYHVAAGTVAATNLDNPNVQMHIGRIQDSQLFNGEIDDVRLYQRALDVAEIQALVEPGRHLAQPPPPEKPQNLTLTLGDRTFSATLQQPAFMVVRLAAGPLNVDVQYGGNSPLHQIVLTPLNETHDLAGRFRTFDERQPRLGVHLGLRRDCGSTLTQVAEVQPVASQRPRDYVFEGAINNFPSPDVEKDNVNYLAGIREIGVRSEYTDGRDMPRLLIRSVEFEGPFYRSWPPATHRNIFIDSDHKDDPADYAQEIIRSFGSRAFRRPMTAAEETAIFTVWRESFTDGGDFQQSIKDALLVLLTSPQFLFLIEDSHSPEPEDLNEFELASKLSYFLWNTAPDEQLLEHAARNTLHDSLDAEFDRLILDPRSQQFVREFTSRWLRLDKFDVVRVDRNRYPRLTRDVKLQLRQEPVHFVQFLMGHNLPLRNLVQSDFIVANEVVAHYYDLAEHTEDGFHFVRVAHQNPNLGGVLSQASILSGLSDGREANPVKRGAWLARKIIADPPDDPPPNVPALPEGDAAHLSLREKLERHRNQQGCAKCHAGIDPWGIPFERFDASGRFRNDSTIDAGSTLPDETEVSDLNGLKAYLASERIDQVAFSFLKHVSCYAVGRSLTYKELVFLEEQGIQLKSADYPMRDMIRFVIHSELFLKK